MAVYGSQFVKSLLHQKYVSSLVVNVRCAIFPAWFLKPTANKQELQKIEEEGKLKEMKYIPVKPAPNDMNSLMYNDDYVNKFTNMMMKGGRKELARELIMETFANIKRKQLTKYHTAAEEEKKLIELNPKVIFCQAIENCKPVLMLTPIKRGGVTYQVPVPITPNKSRFMSMKWFIIAARDKQRQTQYPEQLARELLDAFHNKGRILKRKQDLHKQCENNKAYAHYRWS